MNTTQLECFIKTAYTLNFMSAAEQLNMSQPAISKQIQSLENELGIKLFDRTTRNVKLTIMGKNFLPDAENILKEINKSKQKIHEFGRKEKYAMRIGYHDTNELEWISQILEKVLNKYPNIYPELYLNLDDVNLNELEKGNLDILIAINDHLETKGNICFMNIRDTCLICAVSDKHILSKQNITNFDELSQYPQIMYTPFSSAHSFSGKNIIAPINQIQPLYICSSSSEAYALAATGIGYVLIPNIIRKNFKNIKFLEVENTQVKQFGIYYNKNKVFPALKMFLELAKKFFPNSSGI